MINLPRIVRAISKLRVVVVWWLQFANELLNLLLTLLSVDMFVIRLAERERTI